MTVQQQPQPAELATPPHMPAQRGGSTPATDDARLADTLSWAKDVLFEADPRLAVGVRDVRILRGGAKRLVAVTLIDGVSLVLKQYANDRGAWTQLWMNRLCDAGFAPPARLSVTPARGWSRTHSTLVADTAPEHPWTTWLVASAQARVAAAEAAADWLVALQELTISLPDRSGYRAADELVRNCEELSDAFPDYARSLESVHGAIRTQLYQSLDGHGTELVPSHGDLHPNNLHIADACLSVMAIDVDTAGLRRPAYDVGYAIAQMLIVSWMRTGAFHVGASAGLAFWRRWSAGGAPDADAVGAESARALLQSLHFELITYCNGRTDLLDPWLVVAHSMSTVGVPSTLRTLVAPEENPS